LSTRLRSIATAGLLALFAFGLYTFRIDTPSLSADEIALQRQVQSLLLTGHDLAGRAWPLLLQVDQEHWQQPVAVYATTFVSALAPVELASRFSAALFGAASVGLLYCLLWQIYPDRWTPLAAALLFAVTPAHVVYARTGVDAIYSVPFVIVWLIGVRASLSSQRLQPMLVGTFFLGAGILTQPSAPLTMTFLLVVSLAAVWSSGRRGVRTCAAVVAAFALPVSAVAVWFALFPDTYRDTFGRWAIHAAHLRSPLDGVRAFVNWTTLGNRASIYWGSFDPAWLFFDGPATPGDILHGAAPFLFGTVVLGGLGLSQLLKAGSPPWVLTVLAGGVVTPLAASTFGVPNAIGSFLPLILFVVLIAAEGIAMQPAQTTLGARMAAWAIAAVLLLESAVFYAAVLSR